MRRHSLNGSVALVALCLMAVLGIALASFLAVSNQSMKLNNRAYAKDVSRHLAEMGLERALRAFSFSVFNGSWTYSGITATRTLTISSSNYGTSGITTAINLRVDHYLTGNKAVPWSVLTSYAADDFVSYLGVWYNCILAPTSNQNPSTTFYWTAAPQPWKAESTYQLSNIVVLGGSAYRCTTIHSHQAPPNASYWSAASAVAAWNAATLYNIDDVVTTGGVVYRCITSNTNQSPPNTTYWLSAPIIYSEGVATLPDGSAPIKTQLRALIAPAPLFTNAAGATTYTNLASSGTIDSYNFALGNYGGANLGYSAVLAGGNTSGTAVTVTSATVKGYVAAPGASTSPYAPRWSYGAATVTGSAATGIDLTRISRSPSVPQFDIQTIAASGTVTLNSLTLSSNTTTNLPRGGDTISSDGKYYYYTTSYLYITSGGTLNINSPVIIDVRPTGSSGHFMLDSATGKIVIANNTTASLEVHFGGELYIGTNGGGGIQNLTLDPKRCILLGTSTTNTSGYHYFWTNVPFYGVIYMPNAYLHMWNSGFNEQVYGALSASNIYFNHSANLHYDTSLRTATISGVDAPYMITDLRELTSPAERVTLP